MVVRTIEIVLEFIATVICIQKLSGIKIKHNIYLVILFFIDYGILMAIDSSVLPAFGKLFIYLGMIVYIYFFTVQSWKSVIKIFTLVMLCMMILQYSCYFILRVFHVPLGEMQIRGIMINILVCFFLLFWRKRYYKLTFGWAKKLSKYGVIAVLMVSCSRMLYLTNKNGVVLAETIIQFCVEMFILCLIILMWINSERERRHKEKELQMYKMYNQAFEETINTIRVKQHEFENHINAIKCMKYTIDNYKELMFKQEEYCNAVLKESGVVRLLKLKMEPVLIGFLYAKIASCEEQEIHVDYVINSVDIKGKIEVYEMIELIGILFDNAVDAIEGSDDKELVLKLVEMEKGIKLEIANVSRVYSYSEIEKFCVPGYSTKGINRGIGLTRVKEIVTRINATLLIHNKQYAEKNYLCFEVIFM